jgi:DNA-binding GntR family transcriptional regulator
VLKITGLDELTKSMKEFQAAISELDGEIGTVNFDPNDPESIEQAIQAANRAIDGKVARYSRNKIVVDLAEDLKENTRSSILERAAAARLEGNENE